MTSPTLFMHKRLPDWTARWSEFIKECQELERDLTFDWSHINCTQFMGQGIEAITGHNPYEPYEGTFTNALGAARVVKKNGFDTLDDFVAFTFKEVPIAMAWPGDIALVKPIGWEEEEEAVAVMPHGVVLVDPPIYHSVAQGGLVKGDLYADAVRAFAVGREV